jgi:hypothetical protein
LALERRQHTDTVERCGQTELPERAALSERELAQVVGGGTSEPGGPDDDNGGRQR